MTNVGAIFTPDHPPEQLRDVGIAADAAGLDQLWLWEDCFAESGIAQAATVLASTENVAVGIGLLPVPLRNVALTAMEIATLARIFPGRLLPGVGHGVLDWMGQVGARAESPMALLHEYVVALRSLLHGTTVSTAGRYVRLDDVVLAWPPAQPPPLLVGAIRPKTVALACEHADGVIFTGDTTPDQLRAALARAADGGLPAPGRVVVFAAVTDPAQLADRLGAFAAAGATDVAAQYTGDRPLPLTRFAELVGAVRAP